jgi:hypothetical protein
MTLESARRRLSYDPATGVFTWLVDLGNGRPKAGSEAGTLTKKGYRVIRCGGRRYFAHHLAWFFVHGDMPADGAEVDHVNRNRDDNRIDNLRLATRVQNMRNMRNLKNRNLTSKYKGVHLHRQTGKWAAQIRPAPGLHKHLGLFRTEQEAAAAYDAAARRFHGEFAQLNGGAG